MTSFSIRNGASLIVDDGRYAVSWGASVDYDSLLTFNGGSFTSDRDVVNLSGTLVVNGGSLSGGDSVGGAFTALLGARVEINGGSFSGDCVAVVACRGGTVDLSGHPNPAGITLKGYHSDDAVGVDAVAALPEGYCLYDGEAPADLIEWAGVYTVGAAPAEPFEISFAAGEGSGSIPSILGYSRCILPECTLVAPEGKMFKCWRVGGTDYAPGEILSVTSDTSVEAVWEVYYTVSFDAGEGSGSMDPVKTFAKYTLPECAFELPENYLFKGWRLREGGSVYRAGGSITLSSDVTLTAIYVYDYAITHFPTVEEPYVEVNNEFGASYQWYTRDGDVNTRIDGETDARLGASLVPGVTYYCMVTWDAGVGIGSPGFTVPYAIIHQPTAEEPYVGTNTDEEVLYQWYSYKAGREDIVDDYITGMPYYSYEYDEWSYYKEETGWHAVWRDEYTAEYFYAYLTEGDRLVVAPSAFCYEIGIFSDDNEELSEYYPEVEAGEGVEYVCESTGWYGVYAYTYMEDGTTMMAYIDSNEYTELEGETSESLSDAENRVGNYICRVEFADGTTDESDLLHFHEKNEFGYCYCQFEFTGASLNAGYDLSILYYLKLNDESILSEGQSLAMKFKLGSSSTGYVLGVYDEESGEYVFSFDHLAPQQMTDVIDATLVIVDSQGELVSVIGEKKGYSVKKYASELLGELIPMAKLDSENGVWSPVYNSEINMYEYFTVELSEGDVVYYEIVDGETECLGLYNASTGDDAYVSGYPILAEGIICVGSGGEYLMYSDNPVKIKAWILVDYDFENMVADENDTPITTDNAVAVIGAAKPEDLPLVDFASSLLLYGAMAQTYTQYGSDELATDGLEDLISFPDYCPEESESVRALTNVAAEIGEVRFTAASVRFDTVNRILVMLGAVTENTSIVVYVGDDEVGTVYDSLTSTAFYTEPIYATDFDEVYRFELYEGGELIQTLTYSVNSYILTKINQVDSNGDPSAMANLSLALYRYGVTASRLMSSVNGVEITPESLCLYDIYGTYTEELGWTCDDSGTYFAAHFYGGEVLHVKFSSEVEYVVETLDLPDPVAEGYGDELILEIPTECVLCVIVGENVNARFYVRSGN